MDTRSDVIRVGILAVAALVAACGESSPLGLAAQTPPVPVVDTSNKDWAPRNEGYPYIVTQFDVEIPLSFGHYVSANISLPSLDGENAAPGPFPTLMVVTPYNKGEDIGPEFFIKRGYAWVIVDHYGTGDSPGSKDPRDLTLDQRVNYDVIEWAAAQSWSNGNIGRYGESFVGHLAFQAALANPPHLKAIEPQAAVADWKNVSGSGGIYPLLNIFGVIAVQSIVPDQDRFMTDPVEAFDIAATRLGNVIAAQTWTTNMMLGGRYYYVDENFCSFMCPYQQLEKIKVPVLITSGWFDPSQKDGPYIFSGLQDLGKPVHLLMGQWNHGQLGVGLPSGDLPYSWDEMRLRFFDRYLREDDNGWEDVAPIQYFSMIEDKWRTDEAFPGPRTDFRKVYLDAGSMVGVPGSLSLEPSTQSSADVLPWHPVSGVCSRSAEAALVGLFDAPPCTTDERLNDETGLIYDLPAADVDRRIAGPMAAHLWVSTTARNAFLNVRVSAVAPDGSVFQVSDGNDTLSFRALDPERTGVAENGLIYRPYHPSTKASEQEVVPGEIYEWWVEIAPSAALIPAGYQLRVTIQPSDVFQAILPLPLLADTIGSLVSIHHSPEMPSGIVVPFQNN